MAKRKKKKTPKKGNRFTALIIVLVAGIIISRFITPVTADGNAHYSRDLCVPRFVDGTEHQIVKHDGYTLSYNNDTRNADWVGYELTGEEVQGVVERGENFEPDPLVRGPQACDSDYKKSGWDRGHLAPAADMKWSKKAMNESFYLSNVSPQDKQLNRGTWKKLEELCRDKAELYGRVIIIAGPLFYDKKPCYIGENRVRVPDAFFKVLLSDYRGKHRTIGFLFDNKGGKSKLKEHATTVDRVEELTGLDFFAQLPDSIETGAEASYSAAFWGI